MAKGDGTWEPEWVKREQQAPGLEQQVNYTLMLQTVAKSGEEGRDM